MRATHGAARTRPTTRKTENRRPVGTSFSISPHVRARGKTRDDGGSAACTGCITAVARSQPNRRVWPLPRARTAMLDAECNELPLDDDAPVPALAGAPEGDAAEGGWHARCAIGPRTASASKRARRSL